MVKFFEVFEKNRELSLMITIIIAIIIFAFSSIPGNQETIPQTDILPIIYHFSIFFLLMFFLLISIHEKRKPNTNNIIIAMIISIFYGILDELHQIFVPLRYPSIGDVLIDTLGIIFASFVYISLKKN